MTNRWITTIISLMMVVLLACAGATTPAPGPASMVLVLTPLTSSGYNQDAGYAAAQATLVSGQNEMMELSHQATVVSLNMDQAANVAAQATIDNYQRQMMELSIQGTEVSLNMARAAATQQFIREQTQLAVNATATAQSQSATATVSAYNFNVTQTAQVQAILDTYAAETAQAHATLTAYPLTATPEAATQADIARIRSESARQAWWDDFIVNPLQLILWTVVVILLIVGTVAAYRRFMPVLEFRLRNPRGSGSINPLFPTGGMIVDLDPHYHGLMQQELRLREHPQLPGDGTPQVEIIGPSEPSIINWITEAEEKLRPDGWDPTMSANRYLPAARYIARKIPGLLAQRGLQPFISRYVLTETEAGNAWLFIVLEIDPLQPVEDYTTSDVLGYLSTALNGLPVVVSDAYGLRYAVLLSPPYLFQQFDWSD